MSAAALWQYWGPGLGGMPPGATELRDVPGVGPRHFHAHPDGAVLVFGEPGLGAPDPGTCPPGTVWNGGSCVVAAQPEGCRQARDVLLAELGSGQPVAFGWGSATWAFQAAWNANGGYPLLFEDGEYGGCTQAALASAAGGWAPPALVADARDGSYQCYLSPSDTMSYVGAWTAPACFHSQGARQKGEGGDGGWRGGRAGGGRGTLQGLGAASAALQGYAQALSAAATGGCMPATAPAAAFQTQWNLDFDPTLEPFKSYPHGLSSGVYDDPTAFALAAMGYNTPAPCGAPPPPPPPPPGDPGCPPGQTWNPNTSQCVATPPAPPASTGTSAGVVVLAVLGVAAVGAVAYAALRPPSPAELAKHRATRRAA